MRIKGGLIIFSLLSIYTVSGARCWANPITEDAKEPYAVLLENAKAARNSGEFDRAAALLREVQRTSNQAGRCDIEAISLLNLGIILWDLGEMQEAARKFAEAVPLFEKDGDAPNKEICAKGQEIARNYVLGKDSRSANQNNESLKYFDNAIALGRTTGIEDFELKCVRQKSITYWQLGDFDNFHSCNERGLEIAKKINHRKEVGRCLNNIGAYYIKNSDFTNALRILRMALPIIQSEHDLNEEAICLNNIGIIYRNLGELNLAVKEISRALELDERLGDYLTISEDRGNLGAILLRRGFISGNIQDVRCALVELNRCLSMRRQDPPSHVQIAALSNSGYAYFMLQSYDQAIELFENAAKLVDHEMFPEEYGHILNNIGNAYFKKGQLEKAKERFSRTYKIFNKTNYLEILWEALYGLGCCHEAKGDALQALAFYKKSIEAMEKVRRRISFDMFKISFARNKMDVYERVLDILCSLYRVTPSYSRMEEIFGIVERAKAQAFLESLDGANREADIEISPETTDLEKRLSREISVLNMKVVSIKASEADRKERLRELENKEEEYLRLMSDIKTERRPADRSLLTKNLSLTEAQAHLLDEKSAILEYFVGDKRSYLLMITLHQADLYTLPGRSELGESLRGYLKCLSSPSIGQFNGVRASERIAEELLIPLQGGNHPDIDTLIIVPDGILHYLPFETLRLHNDRGAKFILEKFKISYAPSASALFYLKVWPRPHRPAKDFLAFGAPINKELGGTVDIRDGFEKDALRDFCLDRGVVLSPLPFSKIEIIKAAEHFPPRNEEIYLGDQASESVLKKLSLEEYQIVHFACHGILDDKVPFRSALVLSPGDRQDEDGFLQVREIYNLRMAAELVVLSACQTGNGSLEYGEGLIGLARSFFQAGAHSVVSSIWAVNDRSTASFMEDFYAGLARGEDKSSALRSAKLKVLNSPRAHPFYWASFVLNGDAAPIRLEGHKDERPN